MYKTLYALAALLAIATTSFAQQSKFVVPEQRIEGAENPIAPGELIILRVSNIGNKPQYLTDVTYKWKILEDGKEKKNVIVWPDGSSIVFGAGAAQKITAMLVVLYQYEVKDKDGKLLEAASRMSELLIVNVELANPGPGPGPGPNPPVPPGPGPDFPDGKFKLAAVSYRLAMMHVPVTNRLKGAQAIATSTNAIASAIAAGTLTDPADILKKLKEANNAGLNRVGVSPSEWDNFGNAMQGELLKLYKDKKLNVASDYGTAFREIAEGLSSVKGGRPFNKKKKKSGRTRRDEQARWSFPTGASANKEYISIKN